MPHTCPYYLGYFLISPLRALWHKPDQILAPHVKDGMTVFEPGPGMGFFTLELARRVGATGRVVAVDIQPKMLEKLAARAKKASLSDRIACRIATETSFNADDFKDKADFALAFAVVHEMPSVDRFFAETAALLKEGGRLLFAEPRGHISVEQFEKELDSARRAGLAPITPLDIRACHAVLLEKPRFA